LSDIAIKVENLSKRYRIGTSVSYKTLRESLQNTFLKPFRHSKTYKNAAEGQPSKYIWALDDISFQIRDGEAVGIIGANGSGKSTLLKVLTRITPPTNGRVEISGRVGSLLEVGTGFHPELTGRENISLNAAILGMSRTEVKRKFEEIVDFAGEAVKKFIDTPVKRYSSGMQVRLAFAVAAHLDPEILLVDEVLAVGDAAFQKKCLAKMGEVASGGRTVLFVSHNMNAVAALCESVICLNAGVIESIGPAREQISKYTTSVLSEAKVERLSRGRLNAPAVIKGVRLTNTKGQECDSFDLFEPVAIELIIVQRKLEKPVRLVIRIRSGVDESVVLASTDWDYGNPIGFLDAREYTVRCNIPGNLLNSGQYLVSAGIDVPGGPSYSTLENVKQFVVLNTTSLGDGIYGDRDGILSPYRKWELVSSKQLEIGQSNDG
jgi:lipopolysaccharide transport system ATP-binding protein